MLIRHDLRLVFLHVPKCAGKEIRSLLVETAPAGSLRELWNYSYSSILHRYVDLAHLPLQDLRSFPEFSYLDYYQVLACIRNPYARLPSAVNEYYRQRSKDDERKIIENGLTQAMKEHYYDQLPSRHAQQDPRFIHSQPIHFFTHYGDQPKADFLLRCESLRADFLSLAERLDWPASMRERAALTLRDETATASNLTAREVMLANQLYAVDLRTFNYPMLAAEPPPPPPASTDAAVIQDLHRAAAVSWHWGPAAVNTFPSVLKPSR